MTTSVPSGDTGTVENAKGVLGWLRHLRPAESRRFWLALIVSVIASAAIERNWDYLAVGAGGQAGLAFSSAGGMYQQLVTAGPRTTSARYTAIVDIRPGVEPDSLTLLNICNQRRFIARLVTAIDTADPSVIVLDKYFGPATCAASSPETSELRNAIADVIGGGTPIVVGRRIDHNTLVVTPALSLDVGGVSPAEGFINLHDDTRRVPLRWTARDASRLVDLPTLSVAAARAHRPDLLSHPRMRRSYDERRYPYASFLSEEQFAPYHFSALHVLCGPNHPKDADWTTCTGDPELLKRLHARVVIVGDNTPDQDQHNSVIGPVAGLFLQANYVEALLDERVFDAAPQWLELLLGILVAIALEYVIVTSNNARQLVPRLAFLVLLAIGLSYGAVILFGRYVNPWSVSLIALVLKSLGKIPEWLRRSARPVGSPAATS